MKRYGTKEALFQQWMEIRDNTKVSPEVNKYSKGVYKETAQTYQVINCYMGYITYKKDARKGKEPYYSLIFILLHINTNQRFWQI